MASSKAGDDERTKNTAKVANYKLTTLVENGKRYVRTAFGDKVIIRNGKHAGEEYKKVPFTDDGFPIFDDWVVFEFKLDVDMYLQSDRKQFIFLKERLKEELESNATLKSKLSKKQLNEINTQPKKVNISQLTWHHTQEPGLIQLVKHKIHQQVAHTGGREIWGGGRRYR